MQLEEILDKLTAWFPAEAHKERKVPGTSTKWFYIPHQFITQRLNDVCPGHWESKVRDTVISGDYTVVYLELTICGVTKTGVADNLTFPELNDEGKRKIIGSPVVNAFRAAFKDAAEQFGIGAYLDEQTSDRKKFVQYMSKKGDGRAYKFYHDNNWKEDTASLATEIDPKSKRVEKGAGLLEALSGDLSDGKPSGRKITDNQVTRLSTIAHKAGFTEVGIKNLINTFGYSSRKDITYVPNNDQHSDYAKIVALLIPENAQKYNTQASTVSQPQTIANQETRVQSTPESVSQPLYPRHNAVCKRIRIITNHDAAWIVQECGKSGVDQPGMLSPDNFDEFMRNIAVDAYRRRYPDNFAQCGVQGVINSFLGRLSFYEASGRDRFEGAISWFEEVFKVVVTV